MRALPTKWPPLVRGVECLATTTGLPQTWQVASLRGPESKISLFPMWEDSLTFFSTTNSFSAVVLRATSSSYLRRESTDGEVLGDEGFGWANQALAFQDSLVLPLTCCVLWGKRLGLSGLLFCSHEEPTKRTLDMKFKPLVSGPSLD